MAETFRRTFGRVALLRLSRGLSRRAAAERFDVGVATAIARCGRSKPQKLDGRSQRRGSNLHTGDDSCDYAWMKWIDCGRDSVLRTFQRFAHRECQPLLKIAHRTDDTTPAPEPRYHGWRQRPRLGERSRSRPGNCARWNLAFPQSLAEQSGCRSPHGKRLLIPKIS